MYFQGFFEDAELTGSYANLYGNEDDLQLLLLEFGPVATLIDAAPLQHYHSGHIIDNSDYSCCNANPEFENVTNTDKNFNEYQNRNT